jgi:hypothetical protein
MLVTHQITGAAAEVAREVLPATIWHPRPADLEHDTEDKKGSHWLVSFFTNNHSRC